MERGNPARSPRCVVLLSDFGLADPYVGQMRGTLARLAPGVPILDLTHGIEPFNLPQAGYFLAASAPHFPEDAVFTAVVDPGVGTDRRIVAVERRKQVFLAPDNGLLDLVLQGGDPLRVFDLTPDAITLGRASATFQGRDVFAPLAARLALGEPPSALGTAMDPAGLVRSDWSRPVPENGGVAGQVLHVDRFGNCVLNLRQDFGLPPGDVRLTTPRVQALRRVRTYADLSPGQVGLLLGSQGFLELACFMGSAARTLGLEPGGAVRLAWGAA